MFTTARPSSRKFSGFTPKSVQSTAPTTKYDDGMSIGRKVRRTVTLDAELIDAVERLENQHQSLSAALNALAWEGLRRREQQAALRELVDEYEAQWGAPDPAEVERFARHLR